MAPKDRVVVVGLGFSGYRAYRELKSSFDVVCIDPKDYFENAPAGAEMMIEPELAAKHWLVDYKQNAGLAAVTKQAYVTAITSDGKKGEVALNSGEKITFDYAVICSGSTNAVYKTNPAAITSKEERVAQYEGYRNQIKDSEAVVVVGGGAVGVETAAAIAEAFPGKPVTVVTAAFRLLDRMDEKASAYATEWLEKKGSVKYVYGERIQNWGGVGEAAAVGTITTDKGTALSGLIIKCVGGRPATAAFSASLGGPGSAKLTSNGAIVVEPTLQIASMPNVFAAGDVAATSEEKTGAFANFAGLVAASNVKALAAGKPLQTFPSGFFGGHEKMPMLSGATLGTKDGIMQMGDDVQTGSGPVFMHGFFGGLITKMVAGSWFKGWLYTTITGLFAGQIKSLAKKASAKAAA